MAEAKLLKNTIFYSIGEILPRALSFILLPIYTTYLTPADYGIISYSHTVIMFLYVLGAFALNTYVLRYYFIHEDEEDRKNLLGTVQLTILFLNTIITSLAFALMPNIISKYQIQVPWNPYFRLAFIINFLECLSIIPLVIYRVRQEALKFVALGLIRTFLTVGLTLYFLVVEKRGVLGTFLAQLYILIPFSMIYLGILKKYCRWTINLNYLKEGFRFSAPLIPGSICYILLSMSDRIILERYVSISDLGIYNVASQIALVLNIVIQSGYKSIEPELFRRFGKEGFFDFIRIVQSIFFSTIYISALLLTLYSQEVLFLMTSESFHHAYVLIPALIVGVIMTGQNVIYGGILQGEKRTKLQGTATVIGAIVSISVNLLLVPLFGMYAAVTASALSFIVMNAILFYAMTFPGKSMARELLLVLLLPVVAYSIFGFFKNVCMLGIVVKMLAVLLYMALTLKLLHVNIGKIKLLFLKTNI